MVRDSLCWSSSFGELICPSLCAAYCIWPWLKELLVHRFYELLTMAIPPESNAVSRVQCIAFPMGLQPTKHLSITAGYLPFQRLPVRLSKETEYIADVAYKPRRSRNET